MKPSLLRRLSMPVGPGISGRRSLGPDADKQNARASASADIIDKKAAFGGAERWARG